MNDLEDLLISGVTPSPLPRYSAAVALVQRGGHVTGAAAVGHTARYADAAGTPAPEGVSHPVTLGTIFDLASLTKPFTTVTLLSLVEEGVLGLDEPLATWLPSFATGDRRQVTLRRLMTHTSGLAAVLSLWTDYADRAERASALLNAPLHYAPGEAFEYSCVGYLVAGLLAEYVTGQSMPDLVRERVCAPLGLSDTGYLPTPGQITRTAATEWQPDRGLVRGEVHDENSWSMGGTGGNAGIFGTASDLARFGEMLRGYGQVDGVRVLAEDTVAEMTRDQLPASIDPGFRHGLGLRISDTKSMGPLAADGAFGHTGFTGTSLTVDRTRDLVVVLLTNRVHPSREWSDITSVRQSVATWASTAADRATGSMASETLA